MTDSLILLNPRHAPAKGIRKLGTAHIADAEVVVGFLETNLPSFDSSDIIDRSNVLIEVKAFSLSYRDRMLAVAFLRGSATEPYTFFGSDFLGEIIEVGRDVTTLIRGDRVINDNNYPGRPTWRVASGIPSNDASSKFLILHEHKLARVPPSMSDVDGAAFGVCAQTAYSIVRRLQPQPGERGLVTAGSSVTSLSVMSALERHGVHLTAITTNHLLSDRFPPEALSVIRVSRPPSEIAAHELMRLSLRVDGYFNFIVDPFADVYLQETLSLLEVGGRYITCGVLNQVSEFWQERTANSELGSDQMLERLLLRNLTIMGNCLGSSSDLADAIADHERFGFAVPVSRVHDETTAPRFVDDSFDGGERLGRVVYHY